MATISLVTLTGTNAAALAWPQQDNARSETNAKSMCPSCLASQWMPWSRLCSCNIINIAISLTHSQMPHEMEDSVVKSLSSDNAQTQIENLDYCAGISLSALVEGCFLATVAKRLGQQRVGANHLANNPNQSASTSNTIPYVHYIYVEYI